MIRSRSPCLNGPDFGPYSGHTEVALKRRQIGLNGPDFGPYSGRAIRYCPRWRDVSTGLTSAHIPDTALWASLSAALSQRA